MLHKIPGLIKTKIASTGQYYLRAEPGFDEILAFNLVKGNRHHYFDDHCSMVMSENDAGDSFVYRTAISPMVFAISLAGLLLITLLTVSYEIWKSVRANPVNSLRTE